MRLIATFASAMALVACEPAIQFETTTHGLDNGLEQELAGTWRVEGMLQSDCPDGWRRRLPTGETRWVARDGQLVIAPLTGATETVALWPMDEQILFNRATVTVQDCEITETLLLEVHTLQGHWASGFYEATLEHDGSELCEALARDADVPDQCSTQLEWQARRL